MGNAVQFWCYGCDNHVAIDETLPIGDLDCVLHPLGWELLEVDDGPARAWVCPECQVCPFCEQKHGRVTSKMQPN